VRVALPDKIVRQSLRDSLTYRKLSEDKLVNVKTENQPAMRFNTIKWIAIIVLLIAAIVANSHFANQPVALRLAGWVVLLAILALLAFQTEQGRKVWLFLQDARMELRKVIWPTRQETTQTTLIIIAMVGITALFLWGADTLLLWLVSFLTGQRG
jgi:preprotein translocase subunit SecE